MWKVKNQDFITTMVYNVILYAQRIQASVMAVKNQMIAPKGMVAMFSNYQIDLVMILVHELLSLYE